MNLTLNREERAALDAAVDTRLRSLQDELVHTDDREYRRTVRDTLDRLEVVAQRLSQAGPASELAGTSDGRSTASVLSKNVMHTRPFTALADDLVLDIAARMAENGIRHMPIVDRAGRLIGMVSDRDVREAIGSPMRLAADGAMPEALTALAAANVMSADPVSVTSDVPLGDVAHLFANRGIGAVPVVDDEQRVLGIVSYMDVLSRMCARH
jgi:CBS domain-containing protein